MDELLIQYLSSNVSADEMKLIESWIANDSSNKKYFEELKELFLIGQVSQSPSGFDKQKSLERIKRKYYQEKYLKMKEIKLNYKRDSSVKKLVFAIAATFLLTLGIGTVWMRLSNKEKTSAPIAAYNEISAPLGSRTSLTLPDGTKVWLNAGSKIKYAMDFIKNDREVSLSGEAFFEVSKVEGKRFIVHTGQLDIKVWGTKFNVKAYPDEKTIQTTLVEGSVSIKDLKKKKGDTETYLVPNQTAIFYKDLNSFSAQTTRPDIGNYLEEPLEVKDKVNTLLYTSWKDEKWVIEGQTLEIFTKELERRFHVEISFRDEEVKNYKFNGIIANETLEQILEVIRITAPIDYEISLNKVVLKEDKKSRNIYEKFLKRNNQK